MLMKSNDDVILMILPWQNAKLLKNIQSKMPRTQLAVLGSTSNQNAETLKTSTQQNADKIWSTVLPLWR